MQTTAGVILVLILAASHSIALSRKPPEPSYIPGQVVVRFHESVDSARSIEIVEAEGARIKNILKRTGLHLVLIPDGRSVEEAVKRFLTYPEVLSAEPNYRAELLEN
jgi:thermitase